MSCGRNTKALADLAAGRAPSAGLQAHLDECPACRAALAGLREALAVADLTLGELASAEPAPELRARIRQAAAPGTLSPRRAWSAARWAFAAGCAALVLAVVVAGGSRGWFTSGSRTGAATPQRKTPAATRPTSTAASVPLRAERTLSGQSSREVRNSTSDSNPAKHRRESLARRTEPEVLVPPGQQKALTQLVAIAHRPDVVLPAFAAAGQPSADLSAPADIEIKPLEIVPLDPAEAPGT